MTTTTLSIHEACSQGDLAYVRGLLEKQPSLVNADDQYKWSPIFHAALHRHIHIVRLLLNYGADTSAHDGYVLHYAAEVPDNQDVVNLLVSCGALEAHVLPRNNLQRQLLAALFQNMHDRVAALISMHPTLVNDTDGRGDLPIHHAARNGSVKILELLLNANADIHATTPKGHTVLYCAGGHGHCDCVELLLAAGADPRIRFTHDGKNLLDWLLQYPEDDRLQAVAALLKDQTNDT